MQVGTLTLALGHDALDLLNSLLYGSEEDKEDPAKVLELMEKRCMGRKNVIYERYQFWSRKQEAGETFNAFLASLRTFSRTWDFGTQEKVAEEIRDQIVVGVASDVLRAKLLQKRDRSA